MGRHSAPEEPNYTAEIQKVAELLHRVKCNLNHIDGCGWEYESWLKPGFAHKRWAEEAERLLHNVPYGAAESVLRFL